MFARLDTVTDSLETWIDEMQPDMMIRSKEIPPLCASRPDARRLRQDG